MPQICVVMKPSALNLDLRLFRLLELKCGISHCPSGSRGYLWLLLIGVYIEVDIHCTAVDHCYRNPVRFGKMTGPRF